MDNENNQIEEETFNSDNNDNYNNIVSNEIPNDNNNFESDIVKNKSDEIIQNENFVNKTNRKRNKNRKDKKPKKPVNKRLIVLIIVIVICILITALVIFLKIMKLNKENEESLKEDIDYVFEEETKKEAYDKELTIKSLEETYDINDLIIKTYKDVDGKVTDITDRSNSDVGNVYIEYVEIHGLKNKDVENKINKEIKETVYSLYDGNSEHRYNIYTRVAANFSNILSIDIYKYEIVQNGSSYEQVNYKNIGLNYDLNTGDKINLEDLFISSTPIASLIAKGAYEAMAWDTEINFDNLESLQKNTNMDNRDTTEYDEKILKIINKYNELKGNVNFCISSSRFCITIYDLYNSSTRRSTINIYFKDCKEYITVFKKYAKGNNLYENSNIGMKNIFVLTSPLSSMMGDINYSIYGKVSDKVYVDIPINESVSVLDFNNQDSISESVINKISKDIRDKLKRLVEDLKSEANNLNKGISYQAYINSGFERDQIYNNGNGGVKKEPFIDITISYSKVTIPLDYFKNNFLDLLAYLNYRPKASVSGLMLTKNDYDENLKIDGAIYDENINKSYYYDLEGNYLGDDESALKDRVVENNETNNDNNYTNDYNNENSNGNNDVDTDVNIYDDYGSNETWESNGVS